MEKNSYYSGRGEVRLNMHESEDYTARSVECYELEIKTVSDLVRELQKIISKHGDLPVCTGYDGVADDIDELYLVTHRGERKIMI